MSTRPPEEQDEHKSTDQPAIVLPLGSEMSYHEGALSVRAGETLLAAAYGQVQLSCNLEPARVEGTDLPRVAGKSISSSIEYKTGSMPSSPGSQWRSTVSI